MASAAPPADPAQGARQYVALHPMPGKIYPVRWPRRDRREARTRYFRRRSDALAFAARLRARGIPVAVFVSAVEWNEVGE